MPRFFIDIFSPSTADAFAKSDMMVSGFSPSRKTYIVNRKISKGDIFICYCTKIQRFIGALEVLCGPYEDNTPLFEDINDPFTLRFKVKPLVWLPFELAIPLHENIIWDNLSFTKELPQGSTKWTYKVLSSPLLWDETDGNFLLTTLLNQSEKKEVYHLSDSDIRIIKPQKIRTESGRQTIVSTPQDFEEIKDKIEEQTEQRESIKVQAKLSYIGEKLGYKIWIPKNDRSRVLEEWTPKDSHILLEELPIVFDATTLKTIKNIDVLWIKRRTIVRAFEVEGTTSIYSGILRMADLLSLQPMLDIKIHIVASSARRDSVFEQITRPVFAVMEKGPLAEICSYISYEAVYEICKEKRLEHMADSILTEYEEWSN